MNTRQILLILGILFFPMRFYYMSFIFNTACIYLYAKSCKLTKRIDKDASLVIYIMAFVLLAACIRYITVNCYTIDFRDFYELGRFIPVLFLMMYRECFFINERSIIISFSIYVVADVIVSYLQLNNVDFIGMKELVGTYYSSSFHEENSLMIGHRALGLSDGPGTHGSILSLIFSCLICSLGKKQKKAYLFLSVLVIFMCIMGVVFSQSRTAFVVIMTSLILCVGIKIVVGNKKERLFFFLGGVLAFLLIPFLAELIQEYSYLFSLFEYGLENHSYTAREDKWTAFISMALEKPELFFIGHGKTYFGPESAAMDSEYVFLICVYGLAISFVFFIAIYNILSKSIMGIFNKDNHSMVVFIVTMSGLICGISSSFFLDIRILILYVILVINMTISLNKRFYG